MHGLFFELRPKPGHLPHYFAHVDRLKPVLAQHEGLWFLDRYRAAADPDLLLSHQHWADDAAIAGWRRDALHRRSQEAGRRVHFADYRLRVGPAVLSAGSEGVVPGAPAVPGRRLLLTVHAAAPAALPGAAVFESVNRPGAVLTLAEAETLAAAEAALRAALGTDGFAEAHGFVILRDYGMHDRAEAPG